MSDHGRGRLAGNAALITGGASGIGLASARRFLAEGARVMVTDVNEASGVAAIEKLGDDARFLRQDVTHESHWDEVTEAAKRELGGLDVLVNCAGVFRYGTIEDTTLEQWRETLAINLDGTFLGCRAAVKAMRASGGSIVNLSSVSGLVGDADNAAYNASKGGVRLLTKSIALHCARQGYRIRCNSVHPGAIDTPMVRSYIQSRPDPQAEQRRWDGFQPIGRLGKAEEIAGLILYLACDESEFVTGAEFTIDGGTTAGGIGT